MASVEDENSSGTSAVPRTPLRPVRLAHYSVLASEYGRNFNDASCGSCLAPGSLQVIESWWLVVEAPVRKRAVMGITVFAASRPVAAGVCRLVSHRANYSKTGIRCFHLRHFATTRIAAIRIITQT